MKNLSPSGASIAPTEAHPSTMFKGKAGMSVVEVKPTQVGCDQAMEEYRHTLDTYHQVMTDRVGQKGEGYE
jgi:hypothetical protein